MMGGAPATSTARSSVRAGLIAAWSFALLLALPVASRAVADAQRVERLLAQTPLIDGHNDLPWEIRARFAAAAGAMRSWRRSRAQTCCG
jgi:membrane dipeptidase